MNPCDVLETFNFKKISLLVKMSTINTSTIPIVRIKVLGFSQMERLLIKSHRNITTLTFYVQGKRKMFCLLKAKLQNLVNEKIILL